MVEFDVLASSTKVLGADPTLLFSYLPTLEPATSWWRTMIFCRTLPGFSSWKNLGEAPRLSGGSPAASWPRSRGIREFHLLLSL